MHRFLKFIFGIKLYMFPFLCPLSWVFHGVPSWSCSQAVWYIPLLCVQWKTLADGQRNCPKHVEFYCKNKFEKLVHLVSFIIRIYHDARSPERQIRMKTYFEWWLRVATCFGKRKCPKHVDFHSKNKFEILVHIVCFIIRIYHDARSPERQIRMKTHFECWLRVATCFVQRNLPKHVEQNLVHPWTTLL